jgi:nucleotide-binding universal stress UspA family protein
MPIRTVLCPLDLSELSARELDLASGLCRAFGANLVLHHNIGEAGPGVAMSWMWMQEQRGLTHEAVAEQRLRALLSSLPADLEPRAVITHGLAAPSILAVQEQVGADLILLGTHDRADENHASVTESVVAGSPCPVLALHESALREGPSALPAAAHPWTVLVPTDLSADSLPCVAYALALSEAWPLRIHLLHVIETEPDGAPGSAGGRMEEALYLRLRGLLPAAHLGTARCHVRFGDPSLEIATAAATLGADAIVMGAHAGGLLRRFLTRDTSRRVLHATPCPIWVVPRRWAAAA